MKNFEQWYSDLTADERWLETMAMQHKGKDLKEAAHIVYGDAVSDPVAFATVPIAERRRHVHYKLVKMPYKAVAPILQQEEPKSDKPTDPKDMPIPRGTDEYKARCQQVLDAIAGVGRPVAPMTEKEKEENGQVRPRAQKFEQTETMKIAARNNHEKLLNECRRKVFLEAYPDAEEDEIQAYLDKFDSI